MDKEVLFRGKRLDNGEWVDGFLFPYRAGQTGIAQIHVTTRMKDVENNEYFDVTDLYCPKVAPSTVGQYTGLTDKNGVKIFEGDIIRWVDWKGTVRESPVRYDPEWNQFCVWLNGADSMGVNQHLSEAIEVIGNVHDSPELIGGEDDEIT